MHNNISNNFREENWIAEETEINFKIFTHGSSLVSYHFIALQTFSFPQLILYCTNTDNKNRVFACQIETPKFYQVGGILVYF